MPTRFQVRDNVTGKILVRKSLDAREILGSDPERYAPVGDAARLVPIKHRRPEDESGYEDRQPGPPSPVRQTAPSEPLPMRQAEAPTPVFPPPAPLPPVKLRRGNAAALARGRATAAANRARKAAESAAQTAAD